MIEDEINKDYAEEEDEDEDKKNMWDPLRVIKAQERRKSRVAPLNSSMNVYRSIGEDGIGGLNTIQKNQIRGSKHRYRQKSNSKYDWFQTNQFQTKYSRSNYKNYQELKPKNRIANYPGGRKKIN